MLQCLWRGQMQFVPHRMLLRKQCTLRGAQIFQHSRRPHKCVATVQQSLVQESSSKLRNLAAVLPKVTSTTYLALSSQAGQRSINDGEAHRAAECLGRMEVIVGPMFAGKSSELLRRVAELEDEGKRVVVVKSNKDVRYNIAHVVTHDGRMKACLSTSSLQEIKSLPSSNYSHCEVVAIDEAQFFPDLLEFCIEAADKDSKHVIVAGLDGDYQRQRFGQVLDLIPYSDAVTKLKARCGFCERDAIFSLRIAADARQELVGGEDKYKPVCRKHFHMRKEAVRQLDEL